MSDLEDKYISLGDVCKAISKGGFSSKVFLYLDQCYSGQWAYKAEELYNDTDHSFPFKLLEIFSSSGTLRPAKWKGLREFLKK